jgi:hypothetical protein
MPTRTLIRLLAGLATFAGIAVLAPRTVASSETGVASAKPITRSGVGQVRLGDTFRELRTAGLVGRLRTGCELAGPGTRSARLRAPLRGSVDFTRTMPRRVTHIAIRGGATARGVGVGARSWKLRRAFPRARFDHRTEEIFGITLVRVPRRGGGRLQFAVDAATKRVELIGIPSIRFCE